jgi:hypothetical protein
MEAGSVKPGSVKSLCLCLLVLFYFLFFLFLLKIKKNNGTFELDYDNEY